MDWEMCSVSDRDYTSTVPRAPLTPQSELLSFLIPLEALGGVEPRAQVHLGGASAWLTLLLVWDITMLLVGSDLPAAGGAHASL